MEDKEPNIKEMEEKWEILKNQDPKREKREYMDGSQKNEDKKGKEEKKKIDSQDELKNREEFRDKTSKKEKE